MKRTGHESPGPYAPERELAVAAAEEAGALLRARFREDFGVRWKGDQGDVVTDLDLQAERLVVKRIRERFPQDHILAEESGPLEGEGGGNGRTEPRTWLVDPLDGSNNVVIGLPVYAVGVALCVGSRTVLGVVHDPVTQRTWTALSGGGSRGPQGAPLRCATRPVARSGPVLAWTQGHEVGRDDHAARSLRTALENGSRRLLQMWAPLLTWCMLARGDIDGFVGYRAEVVDLPAGALVAAEAGVSIHRLDGTPFDRWFDCADRDRSFVAGRSEIIPRLLELVPASRPANGSANGSGYGRHEHGPLLDNTPPSTSF